MGKGGPLAFLNKKPWHPGNIRNQEEIWKREQDYMAEVEKREELKRQIEEEREQEDNVTQFQRERLGEQRVEWMYQGGFAAKEDAEKKKEEYLLGKTVDKLPDHGPAEAPARVDEVAQGAAAAQPRAHVNFSDNETWSRLNADPMLTMKRVEMDKVKKVRENLKIAKLQAQIQLRAAAKLAGKSSKDKKHKKEKKDKKERKHKHKRKRKDDDGPSSRSESPSPPPPPRQRDSPPLRSHGPPASHEERHRAHENYYQSSSGRDGPDSKRPRRHDHGITDRTTYTGQHQHRTRDDRHHDRDYNYGSRTHEQVEGHDGRHRDDDRRGYMGQDDRAGTSQRGHDNDLGRAAGRREHHRGDDRAFMGRDWRRDDARGQGGRDDRTSDRRRDHDRDWGRYADRDHGDRSHQRGATERDVERGRGRDGDRPGKRAGYGLQDAHIEEYARADARDDTDLTRRAMAERAAAKEEEEREEAARAAEARRKYRPGQMSAEEKERRRQEMAGNADEVGEMRMGLLRRAHDADAADTAKEGRDTQEYLRSEERRVLLASNAVTLGK